MKLDFFCPARREGVPLMLGSFDMSGFNMNRR
jgi:hypothetical protein